MSARAGLLALVTVAAACAIATSTGAGRAMPANCTTRQLRLSGHLQGATQSLAGTLTLRNRSGRTCALPPAPRRVSLLIGHEVLPTLTVRMRAGEAPPGVPTRTLPGRGHVTVGVRWRNWCGAPRGTVRASIVVTIFRSVSPRLALGTVTTPPCAGAKFSSRVAVSRFLRK
jgi:hypothetical protein